MTPGATGTSVSSCATKGQRDEAIAEFRAAIRFQPGDPRVRYSLGNVLMVQGKLNEAIAEFRAAIRLEPDSAEAHCNLGQALQLQGDYAGALEMRRRGHELGSRRPYWQYPSATWVKDAEHMLALAPRLPALLRGEDKPRDHPERLAFFQMCRNAKRYAAAARLWAEALEHDPKLGEEREVQLRQSRYIAACAAALAGCGQGQDDPKPDERSRARLRNQALEWLRAELTAWGRFLDGGQPTARASVVESLRDWEFDIELAGVRDPDALAKLPGAERGAWRSLWAEVDALLARARGGRP